MEKVSYLPARLASRRSRLLKRALLVGVVLWASLVSMCAMTFLTMIQDRRLVLALRKYEQFEQTLRTDSVRLFRERAQATFDAANVTGIYDVWNGEETSFRDSMRRWHRVEHCMSQLRGLYRKTEWAVGRKKSRKQIWRRYRSYEASWKSQVALLEAARGATYFEQPHVDTHHACGENFATALERGKKRTARRTSCLVIVASALAFIFFFAFVAVLTRAVLEINADESDSVVAKETIAHDLGVPAFVLDDQGRIVDVNDAARTLFFENVNGGENDDENDDDDLRDHRVDDPKQQQKDDHDTNPRAANNNGKEAAANGKEAAALKERRLQKKQHNAEENSSGTLQQQEIVGKLVWDVLHYDDDDVVVDHPLSEEEDHHTLLSEQSSSASGDATIIDVAETTAVTSPRGDPAATSSSSEKHSFRSAASSSSGAAPPTMNTGEYKSMFALLSPREAQERQRALVEKRLCSGRRRRAMAATHKSERTEFVVHAVRLRQTDGSQRFVLICEDVTPLFELDVQKKLLSQICHEARNKLAPAVHVLESVLGLADDAKRRLPSLRRTPRKAVAPKGSGGEHDKDTKARRFFDEPVAVDRDEDRASFASASASASASTSASASSSSEKKAQASSKCHGSGAAAGGAFGKQQQQQQQQTWRLEKEASSSSLISPCSAASSQRGCDKGCALGDLASIRDEVVLSLALLQETETLITTRLQLHRVLSGTYDTQKNTQVVDVDDLLRERAQISGTLAVDGVRVGVEIFDDAPGLEGGSDADNLSARLDTFVFRHLANNLLSNSLKHTTRGDVVLRFYGETPRGMLLFGVRDDGHGVATHVAERLFLEEVTTGAERGVGLGLVSSRQFARAVGGDLWLESTKVCTPEDPQGGSDFRFLLPGNLVAPPECRGSNTASLAAKASSSRQSTPSGHQGSTLGGTTPGGNNNNNKFSSVVEKGGGGHSHSSHHHQMAVVEAPPAAFQRADVYVVEDSALIRRTMVTKFTKVSSSWGCEWTFHEFATVEAIIEVLPDLQRRPNVIVAVDENLDSAGGYLTGTDLVKQLVGSGNKRKDFLGTILSVSGDPFVSQRHLDLGAHLALGKPLPPNAKLASILLNCLDKRFNDGALAPSSYLSSDDLRQDP
eukprot:CAMPEP_0118914206 /NCGR_PEP_ID=MMETSP1166-20130328/14649_1 /TAXON_ID=1104430 /ORGANISM="Chrysoreinhardia sp, Strain CCMP3193" /LENGTH=1125 /DNA_ID=CAMNT_0006853775 /DNA_START=83 /DNA_END=3460 /DNA_ORIENTATION=+